MVTARAAGINRRSARGRRRRLRHPDAIEQGAATKVHTRVCAVGGRARCGGQHGESLALGDRNTQQVLVDNKSVAEIG
jgi:hypothetical protein